MYKRVIIKISGEGLSGATQEHYNSDTIERIVSEIIRTVDLNVETSIVVGGGNLFRGRDADPAMDKSKAHQIGMLASVMNGLYLAEAFRMQGARGVVMTSFDVGGFTTRFSKETAENCMREGAVPIFAGGTGLPFFSTDAITAIRACELNVNATLFAKTVGSVYDADPKTVPNAKRYKVVSYETVLSRSLGVADLSAIDILRNYGIPSVVFALSTHGAIPLACENGSPVTIGGTLVKSGVVDEYYV